MISNPRTGIPPRVVIVSGAAASGKTTLATAIAEELGLPLLARDAFKEALMDTLGSPDRASSRLLGVASYAVLFLALDRLLAASVGAVVESNFSHGIAERDLAGRIMRARAVQVHCHTTPMSFVAATLSVLSAGSATRAITTPTHRREPTSTRADLDASLASNRHEPLDLGIPLLRVDTSDGYAPTFDEIRAFVMAECSRLNNEGFRDAGKACLPPHASSTGMLRAGRPGRCPLPTGKR